MKKPKDIMATTVDNRVYKAARREYVALKFGKCPICKPHRGENRVHPSRSWKDTTKNKTQFGFERGTIVDEETLVFESSTGFRFYRTKPAESLSYYAFVKNVDAYCLLAIKENEKTYVLIHGDDVVFESPMTEHIAAHIDVLSLTGEHA